MALTQGTNSYTTVDEANAYFEDNLQYESWNPITAEVKSRALITSSQQISQIVSDDYKLPMSVEDITNDLKAATAELALYLYQNPDAITQSGTGSNTKRVKAGSAEVEFFSAESGERFPYNVMAILRGAGLIGGSESSAAGAEAFGTCEESSFTDDEFYERGAFR
jgi:hypothetical protein